MTSAIETLISQVLTEFRKDACVPGDDRINEAFIKAAQTLLNTRGMWPLESSEETDVKLTKTLCDWSKKFKMFTDAGAWEELKRGVLKFASEYAVSTDEFCKAYTEEWDAMVKAQSDRIKELEAILAAQSEPATRAVPVANKLSVWSGSMPEINGKSNFTAILHRGDLSEGYTIARSEYPDRVRYEADRVRWLLGEIDKEPFILDYDADKHSGYAAPTPDAERHVANHAGDADTQAPVAPDWKAEEAAFDAYMNEPCELGSPVSRRNMYRNETAVTRVRDGWMLRARLAAPAQPTDSTA